MKKNFVNLVKKYGKDDELHTFQICADSGVELAHSTIDKIVIAGTDVLFYYNENTGDYDYFESFNNDDLYDFYKGLINNLKKH